jgi:hypothetical protein
MRLSSSVLFVAVAVGLFVVGYTSVGAAQTGNIVPLGSKPASVIPEARRPKGPIVPALHGIPAPAPWKNNIYAAQFLVDTTVHGYSSPSCPVPGVASVNDIASDTQGNLIVPDAFAGVNLYQGPGMCGPLFGKLSDTYGQASDAAAINVAGGSIVVANILRPGFVVTCNIASASCTQLTPPSSGFGEVYGVTMALNGDCWATGYNAAFTAPQIAYWAGCIGPGVIATGFLNSSPGGLDIDKHHNLVSSNYDVNGSSTSHLRVYAGCNPTCTAVAYNVLTNGEAVFGHLNNDSKRFVVGNFQYGQIDIYSYTPATLSYKYSFKGGLTTADLVEGAAYKPASQQ